MIVIFINNSYGWIITINKMILSIKIKIMQQILKITLLTWTAQTLAEGTLGVIPAELALVISQPLIRSIHGHSSFTDFNRFYRLFFKYIFILIFTSSRTLYDATNYLDLLLVVFLILCKCYPFWLATFVTSVCPHST